MDMFKELFEIERLNFLSELMNAGFSSDQAEEFLSAVSHDIIDAVENAEISVLLEYDTSTMTALAIDRMNTSEIATRLKVDEGKFYAGLTVLMGSLMAIFKPDDKNFPRRLP